MNATEHGIRELLAGIMVEIVVFAELADEDEVHPDTPAKLLERIDAALGTLRPSDRLWLFDHVKAMAASEPHPDRRRVLEQLARELLEEDT